MQVCDLKRIKNLNELAKLLNHSSSERLYRLKRDPEIRPSVEMIEDFSKTFEDLNLNWLITGKGEPFFNENVTPIVTPIVTPTTKTVTPTTSINDEASGVTGNIIVIDNKAAAGVPGNLVEPTFWKEFPSFSLPGNKYRFGKFICLQIDGDSMHPTIKHNEWIIAEEKEQITDIKNGHVHILITKDSVLCKRLYYNKTKAFVELVSDNDHVYKPEKIGLDEVQKIYLALEKMTGDLRKDDEHDMHRKIEELQAEIAKIWKSIKQ